MLRTLANAVASSVGRKIVLAATGLLLVGFLVEHLYGNLKLIPYFGDGEGSGAFDEYAEHLKSFGWLLQVAEIGLFLLFASHVFLAVRLTLENLQARKAGYVVRASRGGKTIGSASMFASGALILAYLIKHLLDFRFNADYHDDPSGTVATTLASPGHAFVYVAASILVGVHLSHGFQSAFQSLGLSNETWRPVLRAAGYVLSALLALGFASLPLYMLL